MDPFNGILETMSQGMVLFSEGQELILKGNALLDQGRGLFDKVYNLIEDQKNIIVSKESKKQQAETDPEKISSKVEKPESSSKNENSKKRQDERPEHLFDQTASLKRRKIVNPDLGLQDQSHGYLQEYSWISKIAYNLRISELCYPNHEGMYPRLNFLQGTDPKCIFDMFKLGFLNVLYLSEDFSEINLLPEIIRKGVKEFKNGTKTKGIIYLRFSSASPEWVGSKWFPSHHIVQIGVCSKKMKIEVNTQQAYQEYEDRLVNTEGVQGKRALGFKVLYQIFEKILDEKKSWTHGFNTEIAVFSTGSREMNSISLQKVATEMNRIYQNKMDASEAVHNRICKLLKHDKNCGYCCEDPLQKQIGQ